MENNGDNKPDFKPGTPEAKYRGLIGNYHQFAKLLGLGEMPEGVLKITPQAAEPGTARPLGAPLPVYSEEQMEKAGGSTSERGSRMMHFNYQVMHRDYRDIAADVRRLTEHPPQPRQSLLDVVSNSQRPALKRG